MTDELPPLPEPEHPADTDGCTYACLEGFSAEQMRAYALQAVAAERERCAKICEQADEDGEGPDCWGWHAKDYAKAIRATSPKETP